MAVRVVPASISPEQAEAARVAYETGMQLLLALPGRNPREAVRQLRRSIALGQHRDAQAALGYCYRKGWGFRRPDLQLARHWTTLAAEAGSALGAHELAVQLESVDKKASMRWYAQAAKQMEELGQSAVGLMKISSMYRYGDGVAKDDSLSLQWLQRAVAAGDQASLYNLASCYYFGRKDMPIDYPKALELLRRSAQYSDPLAEGLLGDVYRLGTQVAKDDAEARKWYRRAAEHGSDASQLNMGLLSMRNACDLREAVRWLRLAAQSKSSLEIRNRAPQTLHFLEGRMKSLMVILMPSPLATAASSGAEPPSGAVADLLCSLSLGVLSLVELPMPAAALWAIPVCPEWETYWATVLGVRTSLPRPPNFGDQQGLRSSVIPMLLNRIVATAATRRRQPHLRPPVYSLLHVSKNDQQVAPTLQSATYRGEELVEGNSLSALNWADTTNLTKLVELLPSYDPPHLDRYWRLSAELLDDEATLRIGALFTAARRLNRDVKTCLLGALPRELLQLIFDSWLAIGGPAAFPHRHDLDAWLRSGRQAPLRLTPDELALPRAPTHIAEDAEEAEEEWEEEVEEGDVANEEEDGEEMRL